MQSMMFAAIVATRWDTPVDSAADLLDRRLTTHVCAGGAYQTYFTETETEEHRAIYSLATSSPGGVVKCTNEVKMQQYSAVVEGGVAKIQARMSQNTFREKFFNILG